MSSLQVSSRTIFAKFAVVLVRIRLGLNLNKNNLTLFFFALHKTNKQTKIPQRFTNKSIKSSMVCFEFSIFIFFLVQLWLAVDCLSFKSLAVSHWPLHVWNYHLVGLCLITTILNTASMNKSPEKCLPETSMVWWIMLLLSKTSFDLSKYHQISLETCGQSH